MKRLRCGACLVLLAATVAAEAQTNTQTFSLQAGWNSIWLEVAPTQTDINRVFAGLPVEAVWTYKKRLSAVDYIQNVNEPVWNRDQWMVHIATNRFESINNDLFHVFGQRAYLVKMTSAATLQVTGRPEVKKVAWAPDAYNLRGYPVDPAAPPTFASFFRYSSAHFNAISNRLERIYKLNSGGTWVPVTPGEVVQHGIAYWTYCNGASDYQAPLMIELDGLDGIDFAETVDYALLQLINRMPTNVTATLQDRTAPTPVSYQSINTTTGLEWLNLPAPLPRVVPTGQPLPVRLAIRRSAMSATNYGSLLEIKNGAGTRWLVPLTAQRQTPVGGQSARNYTGLWAGHVMLNAVSEVNHATNPATPTPTGSEFNLRLLLHVDNSGVTRLLREVIQLWRDGTSVSNAAGEAVLATPGRYVLVTAEQLIPTLRGSVLRDGTMVGRRMSAAGFDFPTASDANFLQLTGAFGGPNPVTGSFAIPTTFARNPFLHRYHPDHDNLNVKFNAFREEAYAVTRAFELRFSATNLLASTSPDYGYKILTGTYRETVSGVNKSNVVVGGVFRLNRVSEIGVLNQ